MARAGIGRVRVAIEFDGLVERFGRAVPDTAALIRRACEIRRWSGDAHPSLELIVARFGDGDGDALAADIAVLGLETLLDESGARAVTLSTPAELADADAGTGVMLLAGRDGSAAGALAARVPAYLVSDRPPADHRRLAIGEAPRVIAEALRIAVPRPIAPTHRLGSAIAVPAADASEARTRGRAALEIDIGADWTTLGPHQLFHCADGPMAERLSGEKGAQLLAERIERDRLALAPPSASMVEGTTLLEHGDYRLGVLTGPGVLPWRSIRRAHFGASGRDNAAPTPPGAGSRQSAARSLGVVRLGEREIASFLLPYVDDRSEEIFVLLVEGEVPLNSVRRFAVDLRRRLGGAAILVGAGGIDVEGLVAASLWEAERNRVRGALRVLRDAPESSGRQQEQAHADTPPPFPILTLRDLGTPIEASVDEAVRRFLE